MEKFLIFGGNQLNGKIKIKGAKNSILPILSASILCKDKVTITNIPNLSDIHNMCDILRSIGCVVKEQKNKIIVDSTNIAGFELPSKLTSKLRASIFMLGSLCAIQKKAKISYPGGCDIGARPIDISLLGLEALGVKIEENHGFIYCDASNMKSSRFYLRFPSVGATENLMMASVLTKGETIIQNCAKEPEIVDLQNFLNSMGARVSGAGTCEIKIRGVKKLHGTQYQPIGDRIVAGTYMIATLMCGGNVELSNINPIHLHSLIEKFDGNDCKIITKNDKLIVQSSGRLKSVPLIETNPYPLFPTDMQAQIMALQSISDGTSVIIENLFETRFKQVIGLKKMGADILLKGNIAIVTGKKKLFGAEVEATDLRAGACLILAGLCAEGYTKVSNVFYVDRGYDSIEKDLSKLGAKISRIDE